MCDAENISFESKIEIDLNEYELTRNSALGHAFFFPGSLDLNNTKIHITGQKIISAENNGTVFSLFEDRPLYYKVSFIADKPLSVSGFQRAAVLNAKTPTVLTIRNC